MQKLLRFICLVLLPLFILGALLVVSDTLGVRFNTGVSKSAADMLARTSGRIDYLFLGSSSVGCAVDATVVAQEYALITGHDKVFVQMGEGGAGIDVMYAYLDAFINNGNVGAVFIEMNGSRIKEESHPLAFKKMPVSFLAADIFDPYSIRASGQGLNSLLKKLGASIDFSTLRDFSNSMKVPEKITPVVTKTTSHGPRWNPIRYRDALKTLSNYKYDHYRFEVDSDSYAAKVIERMIRLCEKNNVKLFFIFHPRLMYPSLDPEVASAFEEQYNYPLLFDAQSVLDEIQSNLGWFDNNHMNSIGQTMYSKKLAGRIYELEN